MERCRHAPADRNLHATSKKKIKKKRMRRIIIDKTELETFSFESLVVSDYWLELYEPHV